MIPRIPLPRLLAPPAAFRPSLLRPLRAPTAPRVAPTPVQAARSYTTQTSTPPDQNSRPRIRWSWAIYVALALCGYKYGGFITDTLPLGPPPAAGSPEDAAIAASVRARAANVISQLEKNPDYTSWDAYSPAEAPAASSSSSSLPTPTAVTPEGAESAGVSPSTRASRITTGPLASASGIGAFQRIFYHKPTGEFLTIIHFGSATQGWPTMVHGGVSATILDESLGRCAVRSLEGGTGVTARLELAYKAPVTVGEFYAVHARVVSEEGGDAAGKRRKVWVEGEIKSLDGKPCVTARALYVRPKSVELKPLGERF